MKNRWKILWLTQYEFLIIQMTNKSMRNNYISEGFGMQRFEDDLSWVLAELVELFTQTLELLAQLVEKSI